MSEDADGTVDYGPAEAAHTLVLAHGASQPMDAAGMELLAAGLAHAGVRVVPFEFPYMQRRRASGAAAGPTGTAGGVAIGGRSIGGRIAKPGGGRVRGGRPGVLRLPVPSPRPPGQAAKRWCGYSLASAVSVHWIADGDFKPRKRSGQNPGAEHRRGSTADRVVPRPLTISAFQGVPNNSDLRLRLMDDCRSIIVNMQGIMRERYLDYNGSAPLDPRVAEIMLPILMEGTGNASSTHRFGRRQAAAVDEAREHVAAMVGGRPSSVVFTAGATESNNLALRGAVDGALASRPRILVSAVEHASVRETARWLDEQGLAKLDVIPVTDGGFVDLQALERLIGTDVRCWSR